MLSLDLIAVELNVEPPMLKQTMEVIMTGDRGHWEVYYAGSPAEHRVQRHFSYLDRIRYYWSVPDARQAVELLEKRLANVRIPEALVSQYLPQLVMSVISGALQPVAGDLKHAAVRAILETYARACTH